MVSSLPITGIHTKQINRTIYHIEKISLTISLLDPTITQLEARIKVITLRRKLNPNGFNNNFILSTYLLHLGKIMRVVLNAATWCSL